MALTFPLRRKEIVEMENAVSEIQETCPALSPEEQTRQIFAFHAHHFINVD